MEAYKEAVRRAKQIEAEIDALQLLWRGTMNTFTPERKRFDDWLQMIGYAETNRCINEATCEFIRCQGLMFPRQLITFMDRAVTRASIRLRKAEKSQWGEALMDMTIDEGTLATEPKAKRKYKTRNRMSESDKLMRDLEANYKSTRKMLLKSLENCRIGTASYLQHLKALDDQFLKYAAFRREIGILPKNVASQTVTKYQFRAVMGKGGLVRTVPVQTKEQALELDHVEQKEAQNGYFDSAEDEAIRKRLDEDFPEAGNRSREALS